MPRTQQKLVGSATIDVELVVIRTGSSENGMEYALDTSNSVQVTPQTSTTDPVQLIKLGRLIAQKLGKTTLTGHQITLRDNVFSLELMKVLQGGEVTGSGISRKYTPPVAGSVEQGEIFEMDCYSAVYDASGQIVEYEKITYPNCQGVPVSLSTEDDVFRLPEYTINSAPATGEAPYEISYVEELPDFSSVMSLQSVPESGSGSDEETGIMV